MNRDFDYTFPEGGSSVAEIIELPLNTQQVEITGTIHLPPKRPAGGMVSILGVYAGPRGKGIQAGSLTIGLDNQWRIEVKDTQKGGKRSAWRGATTVDFVMICANGLFTVQVGEETLKLSSIVDFSKGGRVFLGQTVRDPRKVEYVPLYGGRLVGNLTATESEIPDNPPPEENDEEGNEDNENENQDALRDIRSRLTDVMTRLDKLIVKKS